MKKGFTLIELLAVIVILAIIAVIAVPIVLNIINESKESANLRNAEFYLDAVELSIAQAKLKNRNIKNGRYNIKNGNICLNVDCTDNIEIEASGEVSNNGSLVINNGQIVEGTIINFEKNSVVLNKDNQVVVLDTNEILANNILGKNNKNVVGSGDGLYVSTETNDGSPTYYYKGVTVNNYVEFANLTWRIIRINEDGTIKLILEGIYESTPYVTNNEPLQHEEVVDRMYYDSLDINSSFGYKYGSKAVIKEFIDKWYTDTLEANYDQYVALTDFCISLKVTEPNSSAYTANFECPVDENGKQYVSAKAGLITIDEAEMAGALLSSKGAMGGVDYDYHMNMYLRSGGNTWTISPAGYNIGYGVWRLWSGVLSDYNPDGEYPVRPVISLNANITVEESNGNGVHGSSTNPYVIKTN